jgi:dipeptidyl aminopeptidase/acylaminoacyl peptidase
MDVPLIPRETIFGNPRYVSPRLSPDGRHLAYLAPSEGVLNLWVRTVGKDDDRAVTQDERRGIHTYLWAKNGEQLLYVQDRDGDENWHLYAVGLAGGEPLDLTPVEGVRVQPIATANDFPDEILVGLNDRMPQLHDVYRVSTRTGERELVAQNDMGAMSWIADHRLKLRVARVPNAHGGYELLVRQDDRAAWRRALSWDGEDALSTYAHAFAGDNETLYLTSSIGSDTSQVRAFNVNTLEETVLAAEPDADAWDLLLHPQTHEPQAAAFARERKRWQVIDKGLEEDFRALSRLHPGDFEIVGRDLRDSTWLVAYSQDKGPVVYYAYDHKSKEGRFLCATRSELMELTLAEMKPISYRARDGLTIHGYLTLPVGAPAKNLPTVVNVHGGPWDRDFWGYSPEAQWLANRGYAVLQVNYRGSLGYGKRFIGAGDREWGGKMQDDVSDGVMWLIDEGVADSERIGIFGGSYGGYAVLSGLTKTPELYACGVDIFGPSNLFTLLDTLPPYWEPIKPMFYRRVGHPEKNKELLRERSPLFFVDRIAAPLLIAQGANDPRVKRSESLRIVEALREAGKTVEYLEFADEGHGFIRPENRLTFYARAEAFLAEHLGGRLEPE